MVVSNLHNFINTFSIRAAYPWLNQVKPQYKSEKTIPFCSVSYVKLNYSCFKHCILVFSIPPNVETEPLRTKVKNSRSHFNGLYCATYYHHKYFKQRSILNNSCHIFSYNWTFLKMAIACQVL